MRERERREKREERERETEREIERGGGWISTGCIGSAETKREAGRLLDLDTCIEQIEQRDTCRCCWSSERGCRTHAADKALTKR